jgi:hypothetical protein
MKVYYAQGLFNEWDDRSDEDVIQTEAITFEINGYVYQVGHTDDDPDCMWFSRRPIEDYNERDTHEVPEKWVPEQGSEEFEEYDKLNNFKLFR